MRSRSSWEDRSSTQSKPTSTSDQDMPSSTYLPERYAVNLEHYVTEQTRKEHNRKRCQARRQATRPHSRWEDFPSKIVKYEDCFTEEEVNTQAPRWSEWAAEAERMDQITKKERKEILARLESWKKENRPQELELVKEEVKETEARWEEDARTVSPQDRELTEVTRDNKPTE